ncbi:sulfur transfer protein TusE [Mannheimia haemolytica]|nr:sulfur transfer protein TusE [Mannheimia haemolytica]
MWHFYLMTIELNNIQYPTDASGYLTNLNDWSVELAEKIAEKEQISLTAEHWGNYLSGAGFLPRIQNFTSNSNAGKDNGTKIR